MSEIVEAAGFILFTHKKPRRFLLMKHVDRWDLPKGHAEPGEDLLTTALRETEEETGIATTNISVDPSFRYVLEYDVQGKKRGDYRKRVTYFLGLVDSEFEVRLTEHVGFEWRSWPVVGSIQAATIDGLLARVAEHFGQN